VLGNPDAPHTYTFIDDFASALVTLGAREEALGEVWHAPSAQTRSTREFVRLVFAELGRGPRLRIIPRALLAILATVKPDPSRRPGSRLPARAAVRARPLEVRGRLRRPTDPHADAIRDTVGWYRTRSEPGSTSPH
jgi:nucleoside-diphosphate-sugar epimerase